MIKLYDHPLSPYSQKVKIALIEKGIEFDAPLPGGIGSAPRRRLVVGTAGWKSSWVAAAAEAEVVMGDGGGGMIQVREALEKDNIRFTPEFS